VVESFPRDSFTPVANIISKATNANPTFTTSDEPGNPSSQETHTWIVEDLSSFIDELLSSRNVKEFTKGEGEAQERQTLDQFHKLVSNIRFEIVQAKSLPFLILNMRLTLESSVVECSEISARSIDRLSRLSRVYVENLEGFSAKFVSSHPTCPSVICIGVEVPLAYLMELNSDMLETKKPDISQERLQEIGGRIRSMLPIHLDRPKNTCLMSFFHIATNLTMVVGHVDQVPLFGVRTPYILLLTPDEGLLHSPMVDTPLQPFTSTRPLDVIFRGVHFLTIPLALHASTGAYWLELNNAEQRLNEISDRLISEDVGMDDERAIEELSSIGVRLAAIDVDVGLIDTRIADAMRRWKHEENVEWNELRIPHGADALQRCALESGIDEGYLGYLGRQLVASIDNMKNLVQSLERQAQLLFAQVNDTIMREATQQMKEATQGTQESSEAMKHATQALVDSQRQVSHLTYVIAVLTIALISLGLYENGWNWQALAVGIGAFLLVLLMLRPEADLYHASLLLATTFLFYTILANTRSSLLIVAELVVYVTVVATISWNWDAHTRPQELSSEKKP
jgi:hypothetical protein